MAGRSMVQRVGGFIVVGGLIAGMSVFASEVAPHNSVVLMGRQVDLQPQSDPGSLLPQKVAKCAIPEQLTANTDGLKVCPTMGTPGAGLNCTGTWRVVCGS